MVGPFALIAYLLTYLQFSVIEWAKSARARAHSKKYKHKFPPCRGVSQNMTPTLKFMTLEVHLISQDYYQSNCLISGCCVKVSFSFWWDSKKRKEYTVEILLL
jgi:hypothetical protein